MDFIDLVNNAKERICESNKKVSYSQRSPIETKKSSVDKTIGSLGHTFSISSNEVIESALFDRITRDCKGELMRVKQIRRFRKVGQDEWFSWKAKKANDFWENDFVSTSDEEAINQGNQNSNVENTDNSSAVISYATNVGKINPFENQKIAEKQRIRNINNGIIGAAISAAVFMTYQMVKYKK